MQTLTLSKTNITYLIKFLVLLGIATGAPLLGFHSQWITGPIVNAALILTVFLLDIRAALIIGILPSTIALSTGLLPAPLAPMIPFIIISNSILVLLIDLIYHPELVSGSTPKSQEMPNPPAGGRHDKKYWLGLLTGSGLKYLFLFFTSGLVIKLLLNAKVAPTVAQVMSWPQFFTALIGGILAFVILKIIKKNEN